MAESNIVKFGLRRTHRKDLLILLDANQYRPTDSEVPNTTIGACMEQMWCELGYGDNISNVHDSRRGRFSKYTIVF